MTLEQQHSSLHSRLPGTFTEPVLEIGCALMVKCCCCCCCCCFLADNASCFTWEQELPPSMSPRRISPRDFMTTACQARSDVFGSNKILQPWLRHLNIMSKKCFKYSLHFSNASLTQDLSERKTSIHKLSSLPTPSCFAISWRIIHHQPRPQQQTLDHSLCVILTS